jgi:transcriptional regulator with XRE-family HTH domain
MHDFAGQLRELRQARGWTMYRLGKASGITPEGISKLEKPGSDPKLSTLYKLAVAFGVKVCELVPEAGGHKQGKKRPGKV